METTIGDVIRVYWSNGYGYSDYRIEDNPGLGPHLFVLLGDFQLSQERVSKTTHFGRILAIAVILVTFGLLLVM